MSFFVIFPITLLDAVGASYLTKRSFGRTAAVANLSIMLLLYLFGLGQRLDIGMYVFFALSLVLVGTCVGFSCKRKDWKTYLDIVRNPTFGVYVVLVLLTAIAMLPAFSHGYDEMTHWAMVVKNMHYYNNLGNLGDTTTMFNRYVPGCAVFLYCFQFFNKTFVCGNLYPAFNALLFSLVLPIPDKFGTKKPIPYILSLAGSLGMLYFFKNNIYSDLRVDALIGVMGAYLYIVFWADRGKINGFTFAEMGLGCAALTLTKTSGIGLAAIALVFVVVDVLLRGRQNIKPFFAKKYTFLFLLIPIAAIVLAKVSWNVYCDLNQVRSGWNTDEMSMQSLWAYLTAPTHFQTVVTSRFFVNFFVGKLGWSSDSFNQPFLLYCPAFLFVTVLMARKKQAAFGWGMFATSMVVLFVYGLINMILYIFSFSYTESYRLMSYSRYFMSCFAMVSLIWMAFVSEILLSDAVVTPKLTRRLWQCLMTALTLIFVILAPIFNVHWRKNTEKFLRPYQNWIACLEGLEDTDHVYYANTTYYEDYMKVRFLATPTRCSGYNLGGSYVNGRADFSYTGDPWTADMTAADLTAALADYDYFFLDGGYKDISKQAFAETFGCLFENGDIQEQVLYDVRHNEDGTVTLTLHTS